MTKVTKKKNRKLRRQIRKTVGSLLMISAIVVAAVPVPDVSANITDTVKRVEVVNYTDSSLTSWNLVGGTGGKAAPSDWRSQVPFVEPAVVTRGSNGKITSVTSPGAEIYSNRDGRYQFAYIRPNSTASNRVAVILGVNFNELMDAGEVGTLEIPDTVDAYKKYTINTSSSGYVAVSQNNTFLYWRKEIPQRNQDGDALYRVPAVFGENGTPITQYYNNPRRGYVEPRSGKLWFIETHDSNGDQLETPVARDMIALVTYQYQPCYATTYDEWGEIEDDDLYVWTNNNIAPVSEHLLMTASDDDLLGAAATPTATATATPTATASVSPTATASASPTATPTATASMTPSAVPTASVAALPTATPTATPSATPTAAVSATPTAEASASPEITPEITPEPTEEPVPTEIPTAEPTQEPVPTEEPTAEPTQEPEVPDPAEEISEGEDSARAAFIKEETVSYSVNDTVMAQRQPSKIEPKVVSAVKNGTTPTASPAEDLTRYYVQVRNMTDHDNYLRIREVDVRYIGRQKVESNPDPTSSQEWVVTDQITSQNPDDGVFAGKGQIVNLKIGDKMSGIGDYAFYSCTGIQSVSLGNGLNTLGNGAFAYCVNMKEFSTPIHNALRAIGKDAFAGCAGLKSIVIPASVTTIGDYCFQGCSGLETIELCGQGENVNLSLIGYRAFENCSSLSSITFPENFRQTYPTSYGYQDENDKLPISYFNGCTSLQYIKVQNSYLDIVDEGFNAVDGGEGDHINYGGATGCSIENFLKAAPDIFYFEGPEISAIHDTATAHSAAFKYLNQDKYEKVVPCPELDENGNPKHEATYIVNSKNQLIDMVIDRQCGIIEIPARIGAYGVETLSSTSFQNNCYLKKITIPATVKLIQSNAFKGCHNLKDVIFSQPENAELVIESNAFNTQEVVVHSPNCQNPSVEPTPVLNFVGSISPTSVPFQYAMDPNNNINAGNQTEHTYITYYSGWPTNLAVRYNHVTDKNELIGYPKYDNFEKKDADGKLTADYADGIKWTALPYMTAEYENAIADAAEGSPSTQEGSNVLNAATNINLPAGIESIKSGLFSEKNGSDVAADRRIESITMNTVDTLEPYTFEGCTNLKRAYMSGGSKIDDYAFKNCENLETVSVAASVSELGIRPFAGCGKLMAVDFAAPAEEGTANFSCENQVIYALTDGTKTKLVECLETRGLGSAARVGPDELSGITEIAEEAFMGCGEIGAVDLSASSIRTIPRQCFAMTDRLSTVVLPETARSISKGAFWNSGVSMVEIPNSVSYIEPGAFDNVKTAENKILASDGKTEQTFTEIILNNGNATVDTDRVHRTVSFYTPEGSAAEIYTENYDYITFEAVKPIIKHLVYFWDNFDPANPELLDTQEVLDGEDAVPPEVKGHEGYNFTGWSNSYTNISRQMDLYAQFQPIAQTYYTVTFLDHDDTVLDTQEVLAGTGARTPIAPTREGYHFTGWRPAYDNITADTVVYAQYEKMDSDETKFTVTFYDYDENVLSVQRVAPGENAIAPVAPTREGYVFDGWRPANFTNVSKDLDVYAQYRASSGNGNGNGDGNGNGGNASPSPTATPEIIYRTPETRKYTVSVSGGSGSGSYAAGDIVAVNAYYMGTGQNFARWTTSTAGVGFANPEASSTTFTMPAANVAITATYNTGDGTVAQPAGTGSTGGNSGGGSSSGNRNSGTTVEVTRPGISNTDIAGATVSGATDNFVVKVTEDSAATEAVTAALQARYGDLSRIKYLPMDISLYDSTGRTKIADTTGISVNITLPLPDDLVQYAGNNRAAAVANGGLEDLNTRFTTVDGVPCINFTATHFSPYTIYVDTANLMDGTIDSTPKTGDPIHPKWFLAVGMACISMILFFKRDKSVMVKRKTA